MAFSSYNDIAQVQRQFSIRYDEADFIADEPVEIPLPFLSEFSFNQQTIDVYTSEASRTEAVIFPILREVYKGYHETLAFWIRKPLIYDDVLSGTPDYMVSRRSALGKTVLEAPLVIFVEAKKSDFEQGWGQCLAELVAAQKVNGDENLPIFGVVTDGKLWEFGQLIANRFTKNSQSYTTDHLPRLFGALSFIFNAASASIFQEFAL